MEEQTEKTEQMTAQGLRTMGLYIKHISLEDHALLEKAMAAKNIHTKADAIRLAIRLLAGQM